MFVLILDFLLAEPKELSTPMAWDLTRSDGWGWAGDLAFIGRMLVGDGVLFSEYAALGRDEAEAEQDEEELMAFWGCSESRSEGGIEGKGLLDWRALLLMLSDCKIVPDWISECECCLFVGGLLRFVDVNAVGLQDCANLHT